MKRKARNLVQLSSLFILTSLSLNSLCYAEKIYTWKDESGKMHYTNNPALVPLEHDNTRIIKMKTQQTSKPKKQATLSGKTIWESQCSTCHIISAEGKDGLRGIRQLVDAINDPDTTPTRDIKIIQAALDDEMDDLAKIDLTPEEVEAVATYIRKQVLQANINEATPIPTKK